MNLGLSENKPIRLGICEKREFLRAAVFLQARLAEPLTGELVVDIEWSYVTDSSRGVIFPEMH